jgi:pyridoxamine 5'-phosphate oxidase
MTKSEILEFLGANPVTHLSTAEGDKPHVRGVLIYRADENGIIFHTGKMKDLHRQLSANPNIEMCFNNGNFENMIQIRVSGVAELVEDLNLKKEIVQKREFLKPWIDKTGYDSFAVYRLKHGIAVAWTGATNFAAKAYVEL